MKIAVRAGMMEPSRGDRVEADYLLAVSDPDVQSGPRRVDVPRFVASGNGEHVWQCLERTCGVTAAHLAEEGEDAVDNRSMCWPRCASGEHGCLCVDRCGGPTGE